MAGSSKYCQREPIHIRGKTGVRPYAIRPPRINPELAGRRFRVEAADDRTGIGSRARSSIESNRASLSRFKTHIGAPGSPRRWVGLYAFTILRLVFRVFASSRP